MSVCNKVLFESKLFITTKDVIPFLNDKRQKMTNILYENNHDQLFHIFL